MEFGIAGRMMMAVEPERLATSPSSTENELEPEPDPIQMLELEVEALTLDLDEERVRRDEQRSVCEKHLRELQNAETDLFECRQALEESEQKLALALVEIEEKSEPFAIEISCLAEGNTWSGKIVNMREPVSKIG